MSAKTISEHTAQILGEIQKVRPFSAEEIIGTPWNSIGYSNRSDWTCNSRSRCSRKPTGRLSSRLNLRDLKSADILEDPPGRFHSSILETRS